MDKVIVVTGGSRGIGAAVSRRLAKDGFAVAVNYTSGADAARDVVASIEAEGGRARAIRADVGDAAEIKRLFVEADDLGPLAALVNAAGVTGAYARVDEIDVADLSRMYAVNTLAPMLTSKEAILRMSTKNGGSGGSIVNFSSVAARLGGLPGMVAYATSKAAIENFTRGLAGEVGPEGIRVNAVAPGMIETDMTRGPLSDPAFRDMILAGTALRRIGEPDEVSAAVSWLISEEARFVTAQTITVSGGV